MTFKFIMDIVSHVVEKQNQGYLIMVVFPFINKINQLPQDHLDQQGYRFLCSFE
jgi:hypothetical protein